MAALQSHMPLYQGSRWHGEGKIVKPEAGQHFGLVWERFFDGYAADFQGFLEIAEQKQGQHITQQGKADFVLGFGNKTIGGQHCQSYTKRQAELIRALGGIYRAFKLEWRFASGLGMEHPVENGFTWHPTLGTPYLPGAGVKGLLRGWLEWNDPQDTRLQSWFGSREKGDVAEQAGWYVFFDAVPLDKVTLCADVMTPHCGKWYEQGGGIGEQNGEPDPAIVPADWHSPVPVTFLAVKNASFLFGIAVRENLPTVEKQQALAQLGEAMETLQEALQWAGAGAKTAVGYGHMVPDEHANRELAGQAEAVRIESLPENLRRVEALKGRLASGNRGKGPGDALYSALRELAAQAAAWPTEERAVLKAAAAEILAHLGIDAKKHDGAKKLLRGLGNEC